MRVSDEQTKSFVGNALDGKGLWLEPLVQLNPSGSLWH